MAVWMLLLACGWVGGEAAREASPDRGKRTKEASLRVAKGGCYTGEWSPSNHATDEAFVTAGERAFDFTVETVGGKPVHLAELLEDKPVALFTGSYSCPVYRRARKQIDRLAKTFADDLYVVIVHGPEAHPGHGDPSPYRGDSWPLKFSDKPLDRSVADRIAFAKAVGGTPHLALTVEPMDNPVWCSYGTVPNGAFLIGQDGELVAVHDWFDAPSFVGSVQALLGR